MEREKEVTKNRPVAVVIPNWNGRAFIGECLDALRHQQEIKPRIIVVDNNSTDDSVDFITTNYPEVVLIRMPENVGFSRAVNAGMRAAADCDIALLNNDAVPAVDWLHKLMNALNENPEYTFAASKVLFQNSSGKIDSAGDGYTPWGMVFAHGHDENDDGRFDTQREVFAACACAALYRREAIDDVGLFEENFFAYYEDVDWSFRARLRGYRCLFVPGAVVYHRYSASSSGKKSKLGREEVYLHVTGVLIKNMPTALILRHLPSIALYQSMIVFFYILARLRRQRRLPAVPFFRFMRAMFRERITIQKHRKASPAALSALFTRRAFREYVATESKR